MSRRKPIDAKILEASKEFDAKIFAETVRGAFATFLTIDVTSAEYCILFGTCLL
jgi:hypothetical protein